MAYTTINKSTDHFNNKLYTGNGSTQSITGVGFQPDFTWLKNKSTAAGHNLSDAVRGANKQIYTNNNNAQETLTTLLTSFDSDGFSLGSNGNANGNNDNYVSWNWKAGGTGSSNTDGTITSTVSANTTAGFSIVKYTGNATNSTVGHGLGVTPQVVIVKNLDSSGGSAEHWRVQHHRVAASKVLYLNLTNTQDNNGDFQSTYPGSSTFSISSADGCNKNGEDHIAYCFAEKTGYSKFGKYIGNGNADGTFVYTGFKPNFLIIKNTAVTEHWVMHDSARPGYNGNGYYLYPNLNNAEVTNNSSHTVDLLSNGFKIRSDNDQWNDAETMIYMAFGQSLVGSNNVPCTAR